MLSLNIKKSPRGTRGRSRRGGSGGGRAPPEVDDGVPQWTQRTDSNTGAAGGETPKRRRQTPKQKKSFQIAEMKIFF